MRSIIIIFIIIILLTNKYYYYYNLSFQTYDFISDTDKLKRSMFNDFQSFVKMQAFTAKTNNTVLPTFIKVLVEFNNL